LSCVARILVSLYKRDRIANLLTWLINQEARGLSGERKHDFLELWGIPTASPATLT
jgi:hypothetical protein